MSSKKSTTNELNSVALITTIFSVACAGMTLYQANQLRKLRSELEEATSLSSSSLSNCTNENANANADADADANANVTRGRSKDPPPIPPARPTNQDSKAPTSTTHENHSKHGNNNNNNNNNSDELRISPIGTVSSVYKLCVGTPRQGLLAPHSRGRIQIHKKRLAPDSLDQLELYSHIWIVFVFHLNTNTKIVDASRTSMMKVDEGQCEDDSNHTTSKNKKKKKGKGGHRLFPSKITPPALGGKKVGIFATRTPHRPNPIGFSLCKLDRVDLKTGCIYVSGLDLVDGTPVLDIKPYVPHYDSVGYDPNTTTSNTPSSSPKTATTLSLPHWVSTGLEKRRPVYFSSKAERQLRYHVQHGPLEFYTPDSNHKDTKNNNNDNDNDDEDDKKAFNTALFHIRCCIQEVLSVDVRSAWQTKKARKGASQADRALQIETGTNAVSDNNDGTNQTTFTNQNNSPTLCTQQLDNLLIYFSVDAVIHTASTSTPSVIMKQNNEHTSIVDVDHVASNGSGCDDIVMIHSIEYISKSGKITKVELEDDDEEFGKDIVEEALYSEVREILEQSIISMEHKSKDGDNSQLQSNDRKGDNSGLQKENKSDTNETEQNDSIKDDSSITHSDTMTNLDKNNQIKTIQNSSMKKNNGPMKTQPKDNGKNKKKKGIVSKQLAALETKKENHSNTGSTNTPRSYVEMYSKSDAKQSILVDPIVQDHEDYNKLKNYWKERAGTKLMPKGR